MPGITRIKIISNWHDWRTEMSNVFAPVADEIYRNVFDTLNMPLDDEVEIVECSKQDAEALYDWRDGIDVILQSNGVKFTVQEKSLNYWRSTVTFEEQKGNGDKGAWYYCTSQYYFVGYARNYWDWKNRTVYADPVTDKYNDWILVDLPALHRADAHGLIEWNIDQNRYDGRRASFRWVDFYDVPSDCIIMQKYEIQGVA